MTWAEWVNSEYNTNNLYQNFGDSIGYNEEAGVTHRIIYNGKRVIPNSTIEELIYGL